MLEKTKLLPRDPEERQILLDAYLLEAALALAEGGYGLGLVRSVVDEVYVQPLAGGGNRTVLVKRPRDGGRSMRKK